MRASHPLPDPLTVLTQTPLGRRVVVRHLIEGGERATDAVGELVAREVGPDGHVGDDAEVRGGTGTRGRTEARGGMVTVRTRTGTVRIDLAQVVAAKQVPASSARAWRIPAFLRRAPVAVLDLDGVVRTFDTSGAVAALEERLGMPARGFMELAFSLPVVPQMLTGKARYADWSAALEECLVADGHPTEVAREAIRIWTSDHGTPIAPTIEVVEELLAAGTPTYIFTNGTDRVPTELESMGLGHLIPTLLNAHDLGFAKPAPEAYAVAHAEIEARLGRTVGRAEVHFTDDRPANVDAARRFGWQGRVFTLPPAG